LFAVELAGARLHGSLRAVLQKYRQPQLPREQHGLAIGIIGKNDGRVAVVVNLALAPLPLAVAPALFVADVDQSALVVRNGLDVAYLYGLAVHLHGSKTARSDFGLCSLLFIANSAAAACVASRDVANAAALQATAFAQASNERLTAPGLRDVYFLAPVPALSMLEELPAFILPEEVPVVVPFFIFVCLVVLLVAPWPALCSLDVPGAG